MEPLAALGLVTNITQLIESAHKIISLGSEIAKSGSTSEQKHLTEVAKDFKRLSEKVATDSSNALGDSNQRSDGEPSSYSHITSYGKLQDKSLQHLGRMSSKTAGELITLLDSLTLQDEPPRRRRDAVCTTLRVMWNQKDVDRLEREFSRLQRELTLRQCFLMRYVVISSI